MPGEPLPLFPLNTVLFPYMQLPLHIFEQRYRLMIGRCLESNSPFGVVLIRSGREVGAPADPHPYGTTARIVESKRLDDGRYWLMCRGERRFRIESVTETQPYIVGKVTFLEDDTGPVPDEVFEQARTLGQEYLQILLRAQNKRQGDPEEELSLPPTLGGRELSYIIGANLQVDRGIQQRILEAETTADRLRLEVGVLRRELPVLRMLDRDNLPTSDSTGRFSIN
jgi:Lon protease-like protein